MAIAGKYGEVNVQWDSDTLALNSSDEPVFILRARDQVSSAAIAEYRILCELAGANQSHVESIKQAELAFENWQTEHEDVVKIPDTASDTDASI